jgi:hypothetical protein
MTSVQYADAFPAEGPDPAVADKFQLFGQFVGTWDVVVTNHWRSTWIGPRRCVVMPFLARGVGDEIVLEGSFEEGVRLRWIFSEITPDSFSWRAVDSNDDGASWTLHQEMTARRRSPSPAR